jgi:hypothetical protein
MDGVSKRLARRKAAAYDRCAICAHDDPVKGPSGGRKFERGGTDLSFELG